VSRNGRALLDAGRGYFGGLLRRATRRKGIRIFRYHGVVTKHVSPLLERNQHNLETFTRQMAYLRRFRVLSLDELLFELGRPGGRSGQAAAVTFDDGFANNLLVADVMARLRLPWTLFVSAGELGGDRTLWFDEFSMLALFGDAPHIEALGAKWPLSNSQERERAFRGIRELLKTLPAALKSETMAAIRCQFPAGESERLLSRFPSLRTLTWAELKQLAAEGVAIGSHGTNHDVHHSSQPREERLRELIESRRELEARLARPCRAFAYPNGDFVPESPEEAASAGYEAAFTTRVAPIDASTSRYLLPRLAAPNSLRRFVYVQWWQDPAPQAPRAAVTETA
jgi:peptidoglycan/xylan/chitin deacetylase (PgdA/CDA1 family)